MKYSKLIIGASLLASLFITNCHASSQASVLGFSMEADEQSQPSKPNHPPMPRMFPSPLEVKLLFNYLQLDQHQEQAIKHLIDKNIQHHMKDAKILNKSHFDLDRLILDGHFNPKVAKKLIDEATQAGADMFISDTFTRAKAFETLNPAQQHMLRELLKPPHHEG